MKQIFLGVVLVLAACGPIAVKHDSDNLAKNGCASASAAIKVLTVARVEHKLSVEQIAAVDRAKARTDIVCKKAPYPTLSQLEVQAVSELVALAAQYKE
jgi:hypothetical protein